MLNVCGEEAGGSAPRSVTYTVKRSCTPPYTEKLTEDTKNASINLPLPFRASSTSPSCSFEYQSHHARGIDSTRLKTLWSFERYGKRMGNLPVFAQRSSDGKLRPLQMEKVGWPGSMLDNKQIPPHSGVSAWWEICQFLPNTAWAAGDEKLRHCRWKK